MSEPVVFKEWCIVELLGHVRLAGLVTEEERFGVKLGRLDIPGPDGIFVTQYFGGAAVYRITATTEEIAREVARQSSPAPVQRWELPPWRQRASTEKDDEVMYGEDEQDEDEQEDEDAEGLTRPISQESDSGSG